jgi:hypothetical protein
MAGSSLHRFTGFALVAGALLFVLGMLLHPPAETILASHSVLAHWLYTLAVALLVAGAFGLWRSFAGGAGEGWAVLALGALIVAMGSAIGVWGPEWAAHVLAQGGGDAAISDALLATTLVSAPVVGAVAWLAVAALGAAMLRDGGWPVWIGYAGIVIGLGLAATQALLPADSPVHMVGPLGFIWLAFAGWSHFRTAPATTFAAEPPVAAGGGL